MTLAPEPPAFEKTKGKGKNRGKTNQGRPENRKKHGEELEANEALPPPPPSSSINRKKNSGSENKKNQEAELNNGSRDRNLGNKRSKVEESSQGRSDCQRAKDEENEVH